MRRVSIIFLCVVMVMALVLAAVVLTSDVRAAEERRAVSSTGKNVRIHDSSVIADGVGIDFENGSIILTNRFHRGDEVEITRAYELIVNGRTVELTDEQAVLVSDFYDQTDEIVMLAKEIGLEGAKVGVEGAKVGLSAVSGVLRAIFTSYTFEEMERDIEREAAKIEAKAEKLEARAEVIEERAEGVEKAYDEMFRTIPALRDLDW